MNYDDYTMLWYFHFERGDVTRWAGWEHKQSELKKENPELYKALEDLNAANSTIEVLLKRALDATFGNKYGD